MPLSEALKASYVSSIGFEEYRERYGLWQASGGIKGQLGQQQARGRLWARSRHGGRAAR